MIRWEEALEISPLFLKTNEFISENINAVISFFINAATAGYADESLEILEQSNIQKAMEPLITGLKIFLGEKVRAPQEVMEIGKDVAKRIKKGWKLNRKGFKNGSMTYVKGHVGSKATCDNEVDT